MELKYFSLSDDRETLKKKYKQLAIKNHPDKNIDKQEECTSIMQEINAELEYCLRAQSGNTGVKSTSGELMIFIREIVQSLDAKNNKDRVYKLVLLGFNAMSDLSKRNPKVNSLDESIDEIFASFRNAMKQKPKPHIQYKKK